MIKKSRKRVRTRVITAVTSAAAVLICSPGVSAEADGYAGDVLFSSDRSGDMEVYLASKHGGEPVNLTRSPGTDNWPVWSPDGAHIAFQSRRNGAFDIYVMAADGSGLRRLTDHSAHDYLPSWTPDGQHITFVSWRQEEGDEEEANHVYIMTRDGSGQRRFIADSPGTSSSLQWSPDGRYTVMSWRRGDSSDLRLMDAEGGFVAWLTGPDAASDGAAEFSPHGDRIAFYSEDEESSRIETISVDGTGRETIVGSGRHYYPRWSPDGCWILWSSVVNPSEDGNIDILASKLNGSRATGVSYTLVTGSGRDAEASWRPGGASRYDGCR